MANPQLEDGFLGIAHSINEAIMLRDFTKRQRKILDLILRLSWGCHKKSAIIPKQSDFTVIGIYETDISDELNWLESSKIIFRDGIEYSFNKDFDQWQVSRVKPYHPEKLSELLRINLNQYKVSNLLSSGNDGVSKTLTENLVKHQENGKQNTNFSTPELATAKETYINIKERNTNIIDTKEVSNSLSFDQKAKDIWETVLIKLQGKINAENYRTWFAGTVGLSVDENNLIVGVPRTDVADYLRKNSLSLIEGLLDNHPSMKLTFITLMAETG